MTNFRKKWMGDRPLPQSPDMVLSALLKWIPDHTKKYSTVNGYEPNNLTAASAWHKIPEDLIASDAFIYKDKKTGLWIQAVGYPLISKLQADSWVDLQMSSGAVRCWTNPNATPRLPQKPYSQREVYSKNTDQITYIEQIGQQNKFTVNGINLLDLNPLGRPRPIEDCEPKQRKDYVKQDPSKFYIRSNSRCLQTPTGIYASISQAAADMGVSFNGVSHHLKRNTPGYRVISGLEYQQRMQELNKSEATE
jgi:hypothetical protein